MMGLALLAAGCGDPRPPASPPASPTASTVAPPLPSAPSAPATAVLLAAGDIASCDSSGDEATAEVLDRLVADHPDAIVATLGDNAYEEGTAGEFARCYEPSWGRHRGRTRPAVGNHDASTPGAAGYHGYFGAAAGEAGRAWYSYDAGSWHVVVLDSNCDVVDCRAGGAQETWLRADLAAHPATCTLAAWHHPRFSSGTVHGPDPSVGPLFQALYDAGADVVLAGHEHNYERFAPLDPAGRRDEDRGIRQFVVGTGGRSHYDFGPPLEVSEVRSSEAYGVLALTLMADGYDWEFVPAAGDRFTDRGSGRCH